MSSVRHILSAITMPTRPDDGLSPRLCTHAHVWHRNSGSVASDVAELPDAIVAFTHSCRCRAGVGESEVGVNELRA